MAQIEQEIRPVDLVHVASYGEFRYAYQNIEEVLGTNAYEAWKTYISSSQRDHHVLSRRFDPKKMRESYDRFCDIAGFGPDEVEIELRLKDMELHDKFDF